MLVEEYISNHSIEARYGVTFALYQNKEECIASFFQSTLPDSPLQFDGWNRDVKNKTSYRSQKSLLQAPVGNVRIVTKDWIVLELCISNT
ncbi:hypothetical protein [Streptococcus suis]